MALSPARTGEKAHDLRDQAAGAIEQMAEGAQNFGAAVQERVSQSVEQARRQTAEMNVLHQ